MGNLLDGQPGSGAASLDTTTASTQTGKPSIGDLMAQDTSPTSGANTGGENVTLAADNSFSQKPLDAGDQGVGHDENSIQWSQIGDVLFDLWFICAATAVVIVLQQIVGFMIRGLKRRTRPAMAA
jgi:hypothetical protein